MDCRRLGRTNLQASEIGLGTEYLQGQPRSAYAAVLHEALERGVNYVDVGVQVQRREEHHPRQALRGAAMDREHPLPEGMIGQQSQGQGRVPILHKGHGPVGVGRVVRPLQLGAAKHGDLVGPDAGAKGRYRLAAPEGRLGVGQSVVDEGVDVAVSAFPVGDRSSRTRFVTGRGDADDGAVDDLAGVESLPTAGGLGQVGFEG
ncbi:MAG: hypothetical protein ACUVX9_03085 [Anaerolineae bacterium]